MDIILVLISLALTVFVLVAMGQLFAINASLKRLVQLAEPPPAAGSAADNLSGVSDADLMAEYKATARGFSNENPARNAVLVRELKGRGYSMPD